MTTARARTRKRDARSGCDAADGPTARRPPPGATLDDQRRSARAPTTKLGSGAQRQRHIAYVHRALGIRRATKAAQALTVAVGSVATQRPVSCRPWRRPCATAAAATGPSTAGGRNDAQHPFDALEMGRQPVGTVARKACCTSQLRATRSGK